MQVSFEYYVTTQRRHAPILVGSWKPILARPSMDSPG